MASVQQTAAETLTMLEERLRRLEFLVEGDLSHPTEELESKPSSRNAVSTRLHNLERGLESLINRSNSIYDILLLHQQVPDLFHASAVNSVPTTLAPASLAQLILAHEQLLKSTSAGLQTIHDIGSIPDSTAFVQLVATQPQLAKVEAKQAEQVREFAALRARSAQLVEQWYESGVLKMGGRWADWEEKLRDCEILVRRQEASRKREESDA
ncbi:uncharacterized protein K489DRAFT_410391 [Dissoconium aciculare CBS 342.82]|jgi:hypothetical protein|uniref:Nuclear distribution protein RO10 n=1 Tax=Dissoconium aciculare CBS 342.82 TaxID=1314786 RepID=A0A6J3M5A0_9PEZI|nr:uncharacterized protein K489DRAFT_410391 [Dissoconium aciculare CBS 342.82]KAF1822027.1 hypothetical protein K489DRAFT_410391 [Dissoconium aciculare CBS 342.82]